MTYKTTPYAVDMKHARNVINKSPMMTVWVLPPRQAIPDGRQVYVTLYYKQKDITDV